VQFKKIFYSRNNGIAAGQELFDELARTLPAFFYFLFCPITEFLHMKPNSYTSTGTIEAPICGYPCGCMNQEDRWEFCSWHEHSGATEEEKICALESRWKN
jgi:hypothetical protein